MSWKEKNVTKEIIQNQTFDMERTLYNSNSLLVKSCRFNGPADGESAYKECKDIAAENCFFNLRYRPDDEREREAEISGWLSELGL